MVLYGIVRFGNDKVTDALPTRYRRVTDALPTRYRLILRVIDALPTRYRRVTDSHFDKS